ncbi:unnamed protein product [Brassicogethes aeneus]|uniref:C-CAP/cofactor C-like domain-containing protein n=1 Tax=Brassicogethes aeneus TaxID=1431903 RepID=A0A9P0BEX8_BRAAE|nr:unnamed protein product [Brassicogethes aeneus]
MNVEVFQEIYNGLVADYLEISQEIGNGVYEQSIVIDKIFSLHLDLFETSLKYQKPLHDTHETLLKQPILKEVEILEIIKDKNREYEYSDLLNLVCESSDIFRWITQFDLSHFPKIIENIHDLAMSIAHGEVWLKKWLEIIQNLTKFLIDNYSKGLTWHGKEILPPPVILSDISSIHKIFDHLSLFRSIKQGNNLVKVLRKLKISEDMTICEEYNDLSKTEEVYMQDDKKWVIEHKKNDKRNLLIETSDLDNLVFIYNCKNCNIVIESNVKIIRLDSCKNISILFKTIYNFVELVESSNINLHCFGIIPKINIDCTDNVNIFVTQKPMNVSIYTTQSDGVKVHFPYDDGQYRTFPISSQLLTTLEPNKGVKTIVVTKDVEAIF